MTQITTDLLLGWPKSSFDFLSKNERHIFHFHQELYWTTYSPLYSTIFYHFSGNFIIPSSQNFLSFWAKSYLRCLLDLPGNWDFFHQENFLKIKLDGHLKVQCLVNMADESELLSKAVTIFVWSSKKHMVLRYPDGSLCVSCWQIPDTFIKCCLLLV